MIIILAMTYGRLQIFLGASLALAIMHTLAVLLGISISINFVIFIKIRCYCARDIFLELYKNWFDYSFHTVWSILNI